jgi:hypothetical protein
MRASSRFGIVVALLAASLSAPRDSAAQNLVENGSFDADLLGWDNVDAGKQWDAFDEFEDPSSGSMRVTHLSSAGTTLVVRQCALAEAEREYAMSFSHVTFAMNTEGRAQVRLLWFANTTCTDTTSGVEILSSEVEGPWTHVEKLVTSPPGTQSALIEIGARKSVGSASDEYRVYFDDIVVPEPGPWSALVGLAVLARLARSR